MVFGKVRSAKRLKKRSVAALKSMPEEEKARLLQDALNRTFECERHHCRLLPERCIQRQESCNPEIYESCMNCRQGLKIAEKIKKRNRKRQAA
jgi:hypothetical protein